MPRPEELDEFEALERFKEARSAVEPILKLSHWDRYDFAADDLKDTDVDAMAARVKACGGLDTEDYILCLKMIDHGLVEPRPVAIKKLWSACIFPLTIRGLRACILSEQSFVTPASLNDFLMASTTPDWPLERKVKAIVEEYARWKWVKLKRRKMTYSLPDALNNDILFFVDADTQEVTLPDDDVPLFRLKYEQAKAHSKLA